MQDQWENVKTICNTLNIGNKEFWEFMEGKVHVYPLHVNDFPWACFPVTNKNNILYDIKVIVPKVIDEATLLVNIHELTHAFELYGLIGRECIYEEEKSERFARDKEKLYLRLLKDKNKCTN